MSYDNDEHRVTTAEEQESVSAKARETGQILKELAVSIGRKARVVAEGKSRQLKAAADDKDVAVRDAIDIQMLGSHIDSIITIFDSTMDRIRQHPYDEQQKLMVGFRKVLQEEIFVINTRLNMAKRLKGLESPVVSDTKSRIEERIAMNTADAEIMAPPVSEIEEAETMVDLTEEREYKA